MSTVVDDVPVLIQILDLRTADQWITSSYKKSKLKYIQLYFQTQGPFVKDRQYKPEQYTLSYANTSS